MLNRDPDSPSLAVQPPFSGGLDDQVNHNLRLSFLDFVVRLAATDNILFAYLELQRVLCKTIVQFGSLFHHRQLHDEQQEGLRPRLQTRVSKAQRENHERHAHDGHGGWVTPDVRRRLRFAAHTRPSGGRCPGCINNCQWPHIRGSRAAPSRKAMRSCRFCTQESRCKENWLF